jgi:hypothetical protein
MFRKRNSGSGDGAEVEHLLQQDTPLDEAEQEQIVQEFEEMQLWNSRMWRRTFGTGGASVGHQPHMCVDISDLRNDTERPPYMLVHITPRRLRLQVPVSRLLLLLQAH